MNENVTKTKEQDGQKPGEDYRDADGILVCGKCGEPRERMFPAGGIFKEPHLVPTMCRCQREEADRQREEAERTEKRRRTERLRKQCFPSSGRYAFCTFDADDGRNAAQSTVCKAFAATFDPKDPEGLVLYGKRGTGKSFHASCIANAVIERGFSSVRQRQESLAILSLPPEPGSRRSVAAAGGRGRLTHCRMRSTCRPRSS